MRNVLAPDTRYGPMLYNRHDPFFRDALELYGEWAWNEVALWQQIVKPGDVVVSGGANIGCHMVALAQLVGPEGCVVAFEPQLPLWQLAVANACLTNVQRQTRIRNAALGARQGTIQVPLPDYDADTSFGGISLRHTKIPDEAPRYPVPVVTIDSLNLPRCAFIQLDIEGMEDEALAGAARTVERCRPALFLEADYPETAKALWKRLEVWGYVPYWHRVSFYNPANYRGAAVNIWPGAAINSWFCVPAGTPVAGLPEVTKEGA